MVFTQETYNLIVKILRNGAPALANDLISGLNYLISENNRMTKELSEKENAESVENVKEEE